MYYLKALRILSNGKKTEVILIKNSEDNLYLFPISQLTNADIIYLLTEDDKKNLEFLIKNLKEKNGYEVLKITPHHDTSDFYNVIKDTEEKTISNIQFCEL